MGDNLPRYPFYYRGGSPIGMECYVNPIPKGIYSEYYEVRISSSRRTIVFSLYSLLVLKSVWEARERWISFMAGKKKEINPSQSWDIRKPFWKVTACKSFHKSRRGECFILLLNIFSWSMAMEWGWRKQRRRRQTRQDIIIYNELVTSKKVREPIPQTHRNLCYLTLLVVLYST